jgi:hypothetical protein
VKEREGHTPSDIIRKRTTARSTDKEIKRERERGWHREAKKRTRDGEKQQGGV